jgi:hypothetical protein
MLEPQQPSVPEYWQPCVRNEKEHAWVRIK